MHCHPSMVCCMGSLKATLCSFCTLVSEDVNQCRPLKLTQRRGHGPDAKKSIIVLVDAHKVGDNVLVREREVSEIKSGGWQRHTGSERKAAGTMRQHRENTLDRGRARMRKPGREKDE